MCISFEASIAAYTIGVVSGALLFLQNKSVFKVFGLFIIFYSHVQLFEGLIYKNNNILWSKLLIANLSLQGVLLFGLLKYYNIANGLFINILLGATFLLALYGISKSILLKETEKTTVCKSGIYWPFNQIFLGVMYLLMFSFLLFTKNNFIFYVGLFFLITYVLSKIVSTMNVFENTPGLWCWFSAITAPGVYYLSRFTKI
jgi:hypothetical protein